MHITKVCLLLMLLALTACAGTTHSVQPLAVSMKDIDKICVVDNPTLSNEIQGLVNRTVNAKGGITAFPISSPAVAAEVGCQIYMTYGGTEDWDFVKFLSSFNLAIYETETHNRVASASGKVPNNLRLDKWSASESLITRMVSDILAN